MLSAMHAFSIKTSPAWNNSGTCSAVQEQQNNLVFNLDHSYSKWVVKAEKMRWQNMWMVDKRSWRLC